MSTIMPLLNIFSAYQGIFLSLVLINRKENSFSNNILSLILLSLSMPSLAAYFANSGVMLPAYFLSFLIFPLMFMFNPLILFYTHSMIGRINKIRKIDLLHFIPSVLALLLYLLLNIRYKVYQDFSLINEDFFHSYPNISSLISLYSIAIAVSGLLYLIYSGYTLQFHTRCINRYFSNPAGLRVLWLKLFIGIIFFMYLNRNISVILDISDLHNPAFSKVSSILFFCLMFITAFFLLRRPDVFAYTHDKLEEYLQSEECISELKSARGEKKYKKNEIETDKKTKYLADLLAYMKSEKPYLDENITLKELSEQLEIQPHHLSIVINEQLNQNFYSFINSYRINDVIAKLADPSHASKNVLELAYESGFNSKSTFNLAFKSIVGMTPTEYRKSKIS